MTDQTNRATYLAQARDILTSLAGAQLGAEETSAAAQTAIAWVLLAIEDKLDDIDHAIQCK